LVLVLSAGRRWLRYRSLRRAALSCAAARALTVGPYQRAKKSTNSSADPNRNMNVRRVTASRSGPPAWREVIAAEARPKAPAAHRAPTPS
jgi:hypothetical protein